MAPNGPINPIAAFAINPPTPVRELDFFIKSSVDSSDQLIGSGVGIPEIVSLSLLPPYSAVAVLVAYTIVSAAVPAVPLPTKLSPV